MIKPFKKISFRSLMVFALLFSMVFCLTGCFSNQTTVEIVAEPISDDIMQIGFCFYKYTDYVITSNNEIFTDLSGKAEIIIKDENDREIFSNIFEFSPENISDDFTYSYVEGSYYVFDVYTKDFKRATSGSGAIYANITLDDETMFNSEGIINYGLPFYYDIKLPNVPATFSDYTSSEEKKFQVKKLTQTSVDNGDPCFEIQFKLLDMVQPDYSTEVSVGYKIYDSNGLVVTDGTVTSPSLSIGESANASFTIYDLDPLETYTMKLLDVI